MNPAPRLIIFDLDGTLVNAYPAVSQSVNHTLKAMGLPKRTHAEIKAAVGWGDRQLMAKFTGEDRADEAIRLYRPHHARALGLAGNVRFLGGARALLRDLKARGYKLAIASNRPTRFTLLILKILRARAYFGMVLCADKAPNPKPHPDILLGIMRGLKTDRARTLYVGDMTIDAATGKAARVRTVVVTTGSSTPAELKKFKPYRMLGRIGQLKVVIEKEDT